MMRTNFAGKMPNIPITIMLALCCCASFAHAETIYRSVGADGEVTYSGQPLSGARESTAIRVESLTPEQRRAGLLLLRQENHLSSEADAQLQARKVEWQRVDREIISAQQALVAAENALQNGRTPLGGERRANIGGGTRLTEDYFQRLRGLEQQVEQAKARLDQAYTARNALQ